jgi:uncharacterized protein (TIGR02147 family)
VSLASRDYRVLLKEEFSRRLGARRPYSMNAFAKDLGLSGPRLSEIFSGKQGLSREKAEEIASRINFSTEEKDYFCDLVEMEHARSQQQRELARQRVEERLLDRDYHSVQQDVFQAISDWYHFGILQLLETKHFREDPAWIAEALGIAKTEAELALERLLRLEVLSRNAKGRLILTRDFIATTDGVPSLAVRKFHSQILRKALIALEAQPVEKRNFSSTVVAVKRSELPRAKEMMRKFRLRFAKELTRPKEADSVYCLSMQMFELTKGAH